MKAKRPERTPSHPDPEIALALDWWMAEAENEERKILGYHWHPGDEKHRRGRPSALKGEPSQVFKAIEGRPLNELSKGQRELAYRIGVEICRGRTQEELAPIIRAVSEAKENVKTRTGAYAIVGEKCHLSPEAIRSIWEKNEQLHREALADLSNKKETKKNP